MDWATLLAQAPVFILLVIFLVLDRRDHAATIKTLRDENARLQSALIDHMNRLME